MRAARSSLLQRTSIEPTGSRHRRARRAHGFSLMEVLIASALLAIVGGLLYTSLSSSIDAKEIVEGTSSRYHLARQALSRMVDEISMAYLSAHRNAAELTVKTGLKGDRESLSFTAFGYQPRVEDAKQSEQREIAYKIGRDERSDSESILRREQPSPDDDLEEGGRWQTLLPHVTELEFAYWDDQTEDWKDEWDTEESATLNRLPSRVRITLTAKMDEDDGSEQKLMTQTRIWLVAPVNL